MSGPIGTCPSVPWEDSARETLDMLAVGGLLIVVALGPTPTVPAAPPYPPAAVATPSPLTPGSASPSPATCDSAAALRAAGLLDEAVKAYATLLAAPTTRACARNGLHAVAAAYMVQADDALRAGRGGTAQGYLDRALQLDPTLKVPDDLRDLGDPQTPGWWAQVRWRARPVVSIVGDLLKALVVALVLLLVWRTVASRLTRRVRVAEFTGTGGSATSALVAVALRRVAARPAPGSSARRESITWVSAFNESVGLPTQVTEAVPGAGLVDALLSVVDRLLPSRSRSITGALLPGAADGSVLGVAVGVERPNGQVLAQDALVTGQSYVVPPSPGQPPYTCLVLPAAYWALWQVDSRSAELLGSRSWESYTLFAVAAELELTGGT